jgi:hypothetical protein
VNRRWRKLIAATSGRLWYCRGADGAQTPDRLLGQ